MAENKKSFVLYSDLIHMVEKMPPEKAGGLFLHVLRYVNDLNPISDDILINIAFEPIKQQLKRDLVKWSEIRCERSKAGLISAEKRKQKQQMSTSVESVEQTPTNPTVNVNVNVNDTVNVNDNVLLEKETKNIFSFKKSLIDYGFSEKLVDEWIKIRKNKKATNSETAFNGFIRTLEQRSCNLDEILTVIVEKSWSGFKWEWIDNINFTKNGIQRKSTEQAIREF